MFFYLLHPRAAKLILPSMRRRREFGPLRGATTSN